MKITTWGIIGPGNIAEDFINDLKLADQSQQVTAVLGRHKNSTRDFAERHSIKKTFTSIENFIVSSGVDIVYIATPHPFHYESAINCLANRMPVLCEKPLCINESQCIELIKASRDTQTFLMEGMWIRFLPGIEHALRLLRQGKIGEIISINAAMNFKAPHDSDNRYFDPALGGGSLLDLGIYTVFLALLFNGVPEKINAIASLTDDGIDENCSIIFNYQNGAQALLGSSLLKNSDSPAVIRGSLGEIQIEHPWFEKSPAVKLQLNGAEKISYPFQWDGLGLQYEINEVLSCIEKGKIESELLSHSFSLKMIKVLDQVREQIGLKYAMYE
jgi:predicted dehydrogenase